MKCRAGRDNSRGIIPQVASTFRRLDSYDVKQSASPTDRRPSDGRFGTPLGGWGSSSKAASSPPWWRRFGCCWLSSATHWQGPAGLVSAGVAAGVSLLAAEFALAVGRLFRGPAAAMYGMVAGMFARMSVALAFGGGFATRRAAVGRYRDDRLSAGFLPGNVGCRDRSAGRQDSARRRVGRALQCRRRFEQRSWPIIILSHTTIRRGTILPPCTARGTPPAMDTIRWPRST